MSKEEHTKNELRGSARMFERLGWGILLACAVDVLAGLGFLGAEMRMFLTALAVTLLIIGIIVRKQASKPQ